MWTHRDDAVVLDDYALATTTTTALMLLVWQQEGQSSLYLHGSSGCTPPTYVDYHDVIPRRFESDIFLLLMPVTQPAALKALKAKILAG